MHNGGFPALRFDLLFAEAPSSGQKSKDGSKLRYRVDPRPVSGSGGLPIRLPGSVSGQPSNSFIKGVQTNTGPGKVEVELCSSTEPVMGHQIGLQEGLKRLLTNTRLSVRMITIDVELCSAFVPFDEPNPGSGVVTHFSIGQCVASSHADEGKFNMAFTNRYPSNG